MSVSVSPTYVSEAFKSEMGKYSNGMSLQTIKNLGGITNSSGDVLKMQLDLDKQKTWPEIIKNSKVAHLGRDENRVLNWVKCSFHSTAK